MSLVFSWACLCRVVETRPMCLLRDSEPLLVSENASFHLGPGASTGFTSLQSVRESGWLWAPAAATHCLWSWILPHPLLGVQPFHGWPPGWLLPPSWLAVTWLRATCSITGPALSLSGPSNPGPEQVEPQGEDVPLFPPPRFFASACLGMDLTRMKSGGVIGSLQGNTRLPQAAEPPASLPTLSTGELSQSLHFSDPSPGLFQGWLPQWPTVPSLPTNLSAFTCQVACCSEFCFSPNSVSRLLWWLMVSAGTPLSLQLPMMKAPVTSAKGAARSRVCFASCLPPCEPQPCLQGRELYFAGAD